MQAACCDDCALARLQQSKGIMQQCPAPSGGFALGKCAFLIAALVDEQVLPLGVAELRDASRDNRRRFMAMTSAAGTPRSTAMN